MKPDTSVLSEIAQVTDSLYLSSARAVKLGRLKELGITCVVNATAELPNLPLEKIDYVKINVEDSPYANLYGYFDAVADKIDEIKRRGGKTLVHCIAGVSRSASLCLAYLMKYEKMSLRKAFTYLKSRRAIIRPNQGFFRQLIDYEKKLFGQESVSMVHNSAAGMLIPDVYEGLPMPEPRTPRLVSQNNSITFPEARTTKSGNKLKFEVDENELN